jgi:16S rRNA (guanine966-N2)-methyltransferase
MRITGGDAKGRVFIFPSKSTSRPTSDYLRENLFNLLGDISGDSFLDLFSGSGSVGLEALSRRARKVVFVEKNKSLSALIIKHLNVCGYSEKSLVLTTDFQAALRKLYEERYEFDVIFSDPPYHHGLVEATLKQLLKFPILRKKGIIILQHSEKERLTTIPDRIYVVDKRKYGENCFTFLRMDLTER